VSDAAAADTDAMNRRLLFFLASGTPGFSLVEMIVVVFLLALAMLGLLSVFDASARINKSEQDVADAQGAVRYGIHTMTRAIRMAGSGGLFVTQAVLNSRDPNLTGITVVNTLHPNSYDNVEGGTPGTSVTALDGTTKIPVRPGTDMIEIRGVINSPLLGFDLATGCEPCSPESGCSPCVGNSTTVDVAVQTRNAHINDDPAQRVQFQLIDDYTTTAATNPMLVLVAFNDDIHAGCSLNGAPTVPLYPQVPYNVGALKQKTTLVTSKTFPSVDFTDATAIKFNPEMPGEAGTAAHPEKNLRRIGILDDLIFFIDNTNSLHPALAQGTRRGANFDVVTLADDVEDMQIAYGVAKNNSNAIQDDDWSPDAPGETPWVAANFRTALNCPRLHGVMITLVAKSHDPDPTYKAPTAHGIPVMNSPTAAGNPREYPGYARYRRRLQTLRINLRNYAYEGG
jgi:type II secretory pathway pseudopilin PulG